MSTEDLHRLIADDAEHLWRPYGGTGGTRPLVASAAGVRLRLHDGGELIDGMSSWWAAIHGYAVPQLDAAVTTQLSRMAHVMFGGLTHEPAVELARRLVDLTGGHLRKVFLVDSGSVAVEVAIKMATQSWWGRDARRTRLLTVRGGYHGDTFGAMAVCDPVNGMHAGFRGLLAEHVFVPLPPAGYDAPVDERWLQTLNRAFAEHGDTLAAAIVEPVVQNAGGMRFYPPWCLQALRRSCDEYDVPLILDEIASGFGRTGQLFGASHAGVRADIVCVGKAMTGGYLSMAATLCTDRIAEAITAAGPGVLMHGPTYMANPLAAAVAVASIDLLMTSPWQERVMAIERRLREGIEPARDLPGVADVRVLGAIGVIETTEPIDVARASAAAAREGVWLRPFGRLIYAMPPYVTDEADTAAICRALVAAAQQSRLS